MAKAKYSKLATNEEEEPLPVRESGRTTVGHVLHTASTDPPVARAFRAPRRTVWTDLQEQLERSPPSCAIDAETRPWPTCVIEWARWLAVLAVPLAKVFVFLCLCGLLLTLDCGERDADKWINCREGFVLTAAGAGSGMVAVIAACQVVWRPRSRAAPVNPGSTAAAPSFGKMRMVSSP